MLTARDVESHFERDNGDKVTRAYFKYSNQQVRTPLIETLENVEVEQVDFIWAKRIPRGKLTLFDGDPGIGKSYSALAIAAALSKGDALPFDKEPEAPLRSLIISAEDGAGDTIKPRLKTLGADMSMIAIPHRKRGFTPSTITAEVIEGFLGQWPAALVVIDPIIAFANRRNTDKASDVRDLLGPLALVAEKHRAAIVLIRHLNKSIQAKALYRGQGSIDFAAACRSAFVFAQDADNSERRLMAHTKGSLAGLQPTIEFYIDKDGGFRWGGESSESADEALETGEPRRGREPEQLEAAKKFLADVLADGAQPSNTVRERAIKTGVAWRTVWRAKEALGIKASKSRESGEWFWRLS
jgi:RecA-family ATPase